MEIQHPLFWHQGLFLQPQHFQLSDRYVQSLFIPYQRYLIPHLWGVVSVTVHKGALGTSSFGISSGTFLFPDGAHVSFPGNATVESRVFEDGWVAGGKPFTVYLGISKWNDAGANVTEVEGATAVSRVATRFIAAADQETPDLHAGGPHGEVKRLQHVLKVFWENEVEMAGDYHLMPVAQLERTPDGVVLSETFIPPALSIGGVPLLHGMVKEIRDQLASRGRQLEGYKRERGIQSAEFGSRDVVYLLALRSLNRFVPLLFHYTEAGQVHPWLVYGLLRQLVGELSSFSENVTALGQSVPDGASLLPEYDHLALWECFQAAHLLILRLLDEITAGPEYVIPLHFDGTYYTTELKPACLEHGNRYFIVLRSEEDPKTLVPVVTTLAKLGARERLPLLIARALPGIGLEHLATPPQELPRRAFSLYFAVDSYSDQWALVEKGHNIALYWDDAPPDLQVELMVVGQRR